ncbi:cytochrome P450 [Sphaerisporangium sp. B11E5]|uniref:cytochrome P450 n=1 Tax=Sphaerisporangium sp. B11E5 TaxID=3153563 RepID=UPI00325F8CCE
MTGDRKVHSYPFGDSGGLGLDPRYGRLRREEPVARVRLPYGEDGWLATRYDDVKKVLSDPRFRSSLARGDAMPRVTPNIERDSSLLSMDPPEHTRIRRLVSMAFTPRRIEAMRPVVQQLTDSLLDDMEAKGAPADLVPALTMPLPIHVICEMLGVPLADQSRFLGWTEVAMSVDLEGEDRIVAAMHQLMAYFGELIEERRRAPADDLLTALVVARDERDSLSEEELIGFGMLLLIAGHETTANQLGNFVYTLLTHPEQLAALRERPELLGGAVEEMLRLTPLTSSAHFLRVAAEDVELGPVTVRAGEAVLVSLPSANRDEAVFDRPDEFVVDRDHNPHIAFSHGAHYCIGASLARMEFRIAIGTLLSRFPHLELAVPADEITFKRNRLIRGLESLPVRW